MSDSWKLVLKVWAIELIVAIPCVISQTMYNKRVEKKNNEFIEKTK